MKQNTMVWIIDSTLRDGLQSPGVVLSYAKRAELADLLAKAGVNELEAGIPMIGEEEQHFLRQLTQQHPSKRITGWTRARQEDFYTAARAGLSSVHFTFPVSGLLLKLYKKNWNWVEEQAGILIETALHLFDHVSVGAMDAFRCDLSKLRRFTSLAARAGAHRVRLADTVGTAEPARVEQTFKKLRRSNIILEFHGHNDLGLAVANSLAAVKGGAHALSLTINGIGERAGNAALEQVVAALPYCGNHSSSVRKTALKPLSDFLENETGRMADPSLPIVGDRVFTHESGVHVQAMMQDPQSYCQLDPRDYGRRHRYVAGSHSGSYMIQNMLKQEGIQIDKERAQALLGDVRKAALGMKSSLDSQDLRDLYLMQEHRDTASGESNKPCYCGLRG